MFTVDLLFAICCGLNLALVIFGVIIALKISKGLVITVNVQQPKLESTSEFGMTQDAIAMAQKNLDKAIEDERATQKQTTDLIAQLNTFMTGGEPDAK